MPFNGYGYHAFVDSQKMESYRHGQVQEVLQKHQPEGK